MRVGTATLAGSFAHPSQVSLAAAALLVLAAESARSAPLAIDDFDRLALNCGQSVAPSTLASIAKTESGFEPFSINDNTTSTAVVAETRESAVVLASKLVAAGHSIDLGLMQINSSNLQKLGLTLDAAFDPCQSIAAGAAILTAKYVGDETHAGQQSALRVALSRYNTGDPQRGFDNGYVHKVELAARYIVPALDIEGQSSEADHPKVRPAEIAAPADPNAPPSWDVWASFDYAAAHPGASLARPASATGASMAVPVDAGHAPSKSTSISASNQEN